MFILQNSSYEKPPPALGGASSGAPERDASRPAPRGGCWVSNKLAGLDQILQGLSNRGKDTSHRGSPAARILLTCGPAATCRFCLAIFSLAASGRPCHNLPQRNTPDEAAMAA